MRRTRGEYADTNRLIWFTVWPVLRLSSCCLVLGLSTIAFAQPAPDAAKPAEEPAKSAEPAPPPAPPPASPPLSPLWPTAEPTAAPFTITTPAFTWEPFAYLRLQYILVQNDPNVAFVGRDDGFELQNARIGARANLRDIVRFVVAFDGAVDERAQNTPQGKLRVGLRDAYVDAVVHGEMFVRAGYFQTWFDPQALVADTTREFIDKPLESRGMRSTEGWYTPGLPPGRSLGAALRLEPKTANKVGFEVAVQNGADEFSSNNDNDAPALSAAGMYRLGQDGYVIAAGRWNPRTVGDLPFRQDETDLQGSLGVRVNAGPLAIDAGGIVQRTTFESTNGPAQNAYGGHAQLLIKIPMKQALAAGYRFAILDPSSLVVTDRMMEHTLGAVLGLPALHMRLQLQLVHVMEQAERELSNSRIQVAAEVAL